MSESDPNNPKFTDSPLKTEPGELFDPASWEEYVKVSELNQKLGERIPPIDERNRVDITTQLFCEGFTASEIVSKLEQDFEVKGLTRESPYSDLSKAARLGMIKYRPDPVVKLGNKLREKYDYLLAAVVPEHGQRRAVIAESGEVISRAILGVARKLAAEYGKEWKFPGSVPVIPEPRRTRKRWKSSQDQLAWWEFDDPEEKLKKEHKEKLKKEQEEAEKSGRGRKKKEPDTHPIPMDIEIRLGWSGGHTTGLTAVALGRVLEPRLEEWERELKKIVIESSKHLPEKNKMLRRRFKVNLKLLFVNLVAGFDTDPLNHPIGFLSAMRNQFPEVQKRSQLMCFSSAPFVEIEKTKDAWELPQGPGEVRDFVKKWGLDIIVTSGGSLQDDHSMFRDYFRAGAVPKSSGGREKVSPEEAAQKALKIFKNHGVVGDILWQPVVDTRKHEIEKEKELTFYRNLSDAQRKSLVYRPMSLLSLEELAQHKASGLDVILTLAPCGYCQATKEDVLSAILTSSHPLISHLIVDRETMTRTLQALGIQF
ncbi:MAG: hypothetical protein HKN23_07470 [Verrucomicrobiales bacterium]|nr:hypothetical protein [Verrucomicrobiales bacterium]